MAKTFEIPTADGYKTVKAVDKAGALEQVRSSGATVTLNSQNTQSTPPIVLPDAKPQVESDGLGASIEANNAALKTQKQAERDAAKEQLQSDSNDIQSIIADLGTETSLKDTLYKKEGVDTAKKSFDEATSQLEAEQLALRRKLEKLDKNQAGLFGGAVEQEKARLTRESTAKQADIAIIQSAAARRYDTAASIADRAVAAIIEPKKAELEAKKFLYENNKDLFNKSDAALIRAEERELDRTEKELETIKNIKLEAAKQGASLSFINSISSAPNLDTVLKIPGITRYMTTESERLQNSLARAQIGKIRAESTPSGITVSGDSPYTGVIRTILGSGKFTKDQSKAIADAISKGEDPFTVIKNQAKNIAGQTEATKITGYETAKAQIEDVDKLLKDFYAKGGSTSYFIGNYEKVVNKLGDVKDPELVGIATQISSALQIYRNAVSGTAYSVQEGRDIASIFPGINKSQGLNTAIINGRKAAFDSTIDGAYRSVLGGAYDQLKTAEGSAKDTSDTSKDPVSSYLDKVDTFFQNDPSASPFSIFNFNPPTKK